MYFRLVVKVVLFTLLLNICAFGATGNSHSGQQDIRSEVEKIGTGQGAVVNVTMLDGTKVSGYIAKTSTDEFTVVTSSGNAVTILYAQVKQVKQVKHGHVGMGPRTRNLLILALILVVGGVIISNAPSH